MALLEGKIGTIGSSTDVFVRGKYEVDSKTVKTSDASRPPVQLIIFAPLTKGTYPVLLFCHGWMLKNTSYNTLLRHIASHGYIIVAPQDVQLSTCAKLIGWLSTGLPAVLPANVEGDMENLALSGHSRGGKIAFALALGFTEEKNRKKKVGSSTGTAAVPVLPPKFKAVIGIDPVGGFSPSLQTPPPILTYKPRSFDMSTPVAVIGTGLGSQPTWLCPPFAPKGVSHLEFFSESKPPAFHFDAKEYGHVDMTEDWVINIAKYSGICRTGEGSKEDMRRSVGGIVVAFLRCYLGGDGKDLNAIVAHPKIAPIVLDQVCPRVVGEDLFI